ncbi:hypothetical protein QYE76_010195 [Lolium multiflorum]|uniref:Uncharacterized protein n=1 Tax=Lolium multiflorum TaxID=4521 RepID=A0AAD8X1M6_LOLMU|nr:hypothetical protein QYE76_010195 [Lolium multiflorum]
MPSWPKLTRHNTPESMAAQDLGSIEWERSKISAQDTNLLKKLGLSKKKDALLFPSEESYPAPPIGYRPFINLGAQFIGYRNTVEGLKESLLAANKRADDLATKLKASEEAREKAKKDASCIEDLRKRLHEAETALSDKIAQNIANEGKIAARLESLNRRFVRKMSQDFVLEKPEDNRLLDALSLLEIHADLVRRSIFNAQTAFSYLFTYFFPKKKEPDTFAALAESFVPKEDLGLALRQENLKIGVEGTIALVAESQQNVDWAKVGEATKMKQDRWPNLIRAAKPHSKKILAFLGYKPTPSSSSAKTELVFDIYTSTPRPSDALPASSYSKKMPVDDEFIEDSSGMGSVQDLEELRQQLQSMKKQTLVIMEQSRRSTEKEQIARQQASEAITAKEAAVTEAKQATSRENFMLELLTDASLEMAAMTRCSGGDGGVDGGDDDDDDDGDDVPLDDDGDGVDFPLREGISRRIPARRRALFSLVFSAPQRRL